MGGGGEREGRGGGDGGRRRGGKERGGGNEFSCRVFVNPMVARTLLLFFWLNINHYRPLSTCQSIHGSSEGEVGIREG